MVAAVTKVNAQIKNLAIPSRLRGLKGFLAWGGSAPNKKIPQYLSGGYRRGEQGSTEDRDKLVTFDEAINLGARAGFDGLSLAALPEFNITMWDFDDCVVDGVVDSRVEDVFSGTYMEYSPSRKGVRAFTVGQLPDSKSLNSDLKVEVFFAKGAVRLSGDPTPKTIKDGCVDTISTLNERIIQFYHDTFPDPLEPKESASASRDRVGATLEQAREALSHIEPTPKFAFLSPIGMALKHEFGDEVFDIWNEWRAQDAKNYPGLKKLKARWATFKRTKGSLITFRHVMKLANEAGAGMYISQVASIEDFEQLVEQPKPEHKKRRFQPIQAAEFTKRPPLEWIVKGLVPKSELAVIYGEPGCGKSFLALDMALAIARGEDWNDRITKQGSVIYIAAEGAGGFGQRLAAYGQHHQVDLADVPFYMIDGGPNLLKKEDAVELTQDIQSVCERPSVVVLDTLAQSTPGGSENDSSDMGTALSHCKAIHKTLGCLVLLIHHSGKDVRKGARGWSGLRGAVDVELCVERREVGRCVRVTKNKDGRDGLTIGFDLHQVTLGVDEDMVEITSNVVVEAAVAEKETKPVTFGRWETMIIKEARAQLKVNKTVSIDDVVNSIHENLEPLEEGKRDQRKQNMKRAVKRLNENAHSPITVVGEDLEWIGEEL